MRKDRRDGLQRVGSTVVGITVAPITTTLVAILVVIVTTLCLVTTVASQAYAQERARIDLDGAWQFQTDPQQVGERERWATTDAPLARTIQVPGAWQAQGVGEPTGVLRHHYAGDAWYRRTVAVPATWKGRRIILAIGGAHRSTMAFINGERIGSHDGFSAPFEFEVSAAIRPGRDNTIALRVSNPGKTDIASPDKQAGAQATGMINYIANWGGLYSHVQLIATERVWIDRVLIVPDAAARTARVDVTLGSQDGGNVRGARLRVAVANLTGATAEVPATVGADGAITASVVVPMKNATLWTPDTPALYTAAITLIDRRGRARDRVDERFGLRTIGTRGPTLLLNGQPLYLRGYGDDNVELLSGLPPASIEIYRERLARAKAYGFNAVRFHSMTPVREYFDAADELGLLVMAELPVAYTQYLLPHKALLRGELTRTLLAHRNHPSLLSLAFGNEFNLGWLKTEEEKQAFRQTVADLYKEAKALDPTRPIMSNDGYRLEPTDLVSLYTGYGDTVPTVRHEFGSYYCSLPDPSLIPAFTGVVTPTWLETKRGWVEKQGLTASYPTYVRNSQRLQQIGRAFQIETIRRDARVTGYHYWLITDYPGGTGEGDSWEEGWFDYLWQPKGVPPEEGRRLNSAVLAMIDAGVDRRAFWSGDGKRVQVTVSNYGDAPLAAASAAWRWVSDGQVLASGTAAVSVPQGEVQPAFTATLPQGPADRAAVVDLEVTIVPGGPTSAPLAPIANRWRFWSVPSSARRGPSETATPAAATGAAPAGAAPVGSARVGSAPGVASASDDLLVTSALDDRARAALDAGGRVLLLAEPAPAPPKAKTNPRAIGFFPGPGAAIGTIVRDHPALDGLPHEGFADLQFYNLMQGAGTFALDTAPRDLEPIIDAVRTASGWLSASKDLTRSGLLIEAAVGRGRLLATTFNVRTRLNDEHPEVVWFHDRLVRYARSDRFTPRTSLTWDQARALMAPLEAEPSSAAKPD